MRTMSAMGALVAMAMAFGACGEPKPASSPDPKTTSTGDPTKDTDGDGVPDHVDKCPDKKEDGQGTDPKDGCPNADAPTKK